jgi:RimJ/RimL family protein N-acetyltransferase
MQPTLATRRLTLRPADARDLDALHAIWATPEVRRYLWDDQEVTRAMAEAALADALALGASGLGLWVLEAREAVIGCAGLFPVRTAAEHEPRIAGMTEPLVALSPAVWGRGYAGEALAALLAYAAETLGLDRLAGVTDVPNTASDRMLRRAGFEVLGETTGPRYPMRTYLWERGTGSGETATA